MNVHQNIPFNPGVGPIEIKTVILAHFDHIVDKMNNWLRAVSTGEVDNVGIPDCPTEIITPKNAVPARLDSTSAVRRLEFGGGLWKMTIAHDEGRIIQ